MIVAFPSEELTAAHWIDLVEPSPEEVQRVHEVTGLRVPTRDQISEIESTSRLAYDGGVFYVTTPLYAPGEHDEPMLVPVGFVLSHEVLLTVRFAKLPSFEEAHSVCAKGHTKTAEEAFLHLLEAIVDRAADKLEHARGVCDELAKDVFKRGTETSDSMKLKVTLKGLGVIAHRLSLVRDTLLGIGRIVAYITDGGFKRAPAVNEGRLHAIRTDVASLAEYESHLQNKVQFTLDATLGFINIQQNDIVKTLTIASVVGIPPVLVAGIYGMNFRYMPELQWPHGYAFALTLIVVTSLVPLAWFKWRRWM